jgi:hypothetical protein
MLPEDASGLVSSSRSPLRPEFAVGVEACEDEGYPLVHVRFGWEPLTRW